MRFVRYLLVQALAYGLDMGGFVLLSAHFEIDPLVANIVGKVLAGLFAFVAHRSFTFCVAEAGVKAQQAVRYFTLLALNIPFSAVVLGAMLSVIPMVIVAKFVADAVCISLTFWASKRFVFLGRDAAEGNVVNDRRDK